MKHKLNLIILLLFVNIILISNCLASPIIIQYFYQNGCRDCEVTEPIIENISKQYQSNIKILKIDASTYDGFNQWNSYSFIEVPAIVINNKTQISKDEINENYLQITIDGYLANKNNDSSYTNNQEFNKKIEDGYINSNLNIPLAYSLGLFAGFSPCFMAVLVFILGYTAGTSNGARNGISKSLVFGFGLMFSYLVVGLFLFSMKNTYAELDDFSLITGIVVILAGMNILGVIKLPIAIGRYFENTLRTYITTWKGTFALGILFSFVKVPCTFPLLLVLLNKTITTGTLDNILILLIFIGGILTPFFIVGLIGSCTLSKRLRLYKAQIKIFIGFGLIIMGLLTIL
jgi:cytochrome c biogenesis protein CcdA